MAGYGYPVGEQEDDLGLDLKTGDTPEAEDEGLEGLGELEGPPEGEGEDLGLDLGEEGEMLEVDSDKLRDLLRDVEDGVLGAEEAYDQLSGVEGMEDLGEPEEGDLEGLEELGGGGEEEGLEDLGEPTPDEEIGLEGYLESTVRKIANLITEDPDILNG